MLYDIHPLRGKVALRGGGGGHKKTIAVVRRTQGRRAGHRNVTSTLLHVSSISRGPHPPSQIIPLLHPPRPPPPRDGGGGTMWLTNRNSARDSRTRKASNATCRGKCCWSNRSPRSECSRSPPGRERRRPPYEPGCSYHRGAVAVGESQKRHPREELPSSLQRWMECDVQRGNVKKSMTNATGVAPLCLVKAKCQHKSTTTQENPDPPCRRCRMPPSCHHRLLSVESNRGTLCGVLFPLLSVAVSVACLRLPWLALGVWPYVSACSSRRWPRVLPRR